MARKQPKIPQNVALLQRRYEDAQRQFDVAYQERIQQYTGEISAFEGRIADYEQQAQSYLDGVQQYSQYLNSFFIEPGSNNPQTFVNYGGQFFWAEDVTPGFDLRSINMLPALSGGQYQFVQTGAKPHQYSYQEQVWVPSSRTEMQSYTAYEYQMRTSYEMVYVPPSYGSSVTGNYATGNFSSSTGYYEYRPVTRNELVPVTRQRMVNVDTSSYQTRTQFRTEQVSVGYLKTQTPEGEFTTLRPEQFAVRSEPATFSAPAPEAPGAVDIADIRGELEKEQAYLQRETGEIRAASRRARMRSQARPLLSEGEPA